MATETAEKEDKKTSTEDKLVHEFKGKFFYAVGRRKSATAQVRLYPGKGKIVANRKEMADYFSLGKGYSVIPKTISEPLELVGLKGKYDVDIRLSGGGKLAQAQAARLGIARALVVADPALRPTFRKSGFLTRDSREKERKKVGLHGARRGQQFRKR